MTRKELLDNIKPLSWIERNTTIISILRGRRAGVNYVIDKSYKEKVTLEIRDYIRGTGFIECNSVEEAIKKANDYMIDKIIQYFNIEEGI